MTKPKERPVYVGCGACGRIGVRLVDGKPRPCRYCGKGGEPSPEQQIAALREALRKHWPARIICDHEAKTDQVVCSCSMVTLPVCTSVGKAIDAWRTHVLEVAAIATPSPAAEQITDLERERDDWQETARQNECNRDYYRGLVAEIGEMFGVAAKTSDDGTVQEDVLCAKVPGLVKELREALEPFAELADECDEFTPKGATYTGIDMRIADLRQARKVLRGEQ